MGIIRKKKNISLWLIFAIIITTFSFSTKVYAEEINVIPKRVKLANTFDRENLGNTIASGSSSSSIWITEDNRVKIYNSSNTDGEWGQGHSNNLTKSDHPDGLFVKSPDGKSDLSGIVQVSTRGLRSTALDHEGNVYIWGGNVAGAAGKSSDTKHLNLPNKIKISGEEIHKVLQGNTKTMVLTEAGNMYITGHQAYNDRGNWSSNSSSSSFEKVKFPHGKIYQGFNHIRATFIITTEGEAYFTGKVPTNVDKSKGFQKVTDSVEAAKEWVKITPPGKKVISGALSGDNSFYMLTQDGEIWFQGLVGTSKTNNRTGVDVKSITGIELEDNDDRYYAYKPESISKHAELPKNIKEISAATFGLITLTEDGVCYVTKGDKIEKIETDEFVTRIGETYPGSGTADIITSTGEKAELSGSKLTEPQEIPGRTSVLALQKAENTLNSEDIKEADKVIGEMIDSYLKDELKDRLEQLKKNAPLINQLRDEVVNIDVVNQNLDEAVKDYNRMKKEYDNLNNSITNLNIKESHAFIEIMTTLRDKNLEINNERDNYKEIQEKIKKYNNNLKNNKQPIETMKTNLKTLNSDVKKQGLRNKILLKEVNEELRELEEKLENNITAYKKLKETRALAEKVKQGENIAKSEKREDFHKNLVYYISNRENFRNKDYLLESEKMLKEIQDIVKNVEFKITRGWVNENVNIEEDWADNYIIKESELLDKNTSKYKLKILNLLNEEKVIEYVLPFVDLKEPEIDIKKVETGGTPLS